jgi:hypothetical protein
MYTNFTDSLRIINSTMAGNVAAQGGAVVMSYHSFSEITNSILWQNTNGISLDDGSLRIRHSDLEGGAGGITITGDAWIEWEQSIDTDPLFCSSGEHPFSLAETSPCIDSGTPDTTGLFLPPWDLAGNPRLWDGDGDGIAVIDMGAYEYNGVYVGENEMQVAGCRLQVFPNPSFGISNISYQVGSKQLAVGNHVRLEIYDMKGKEIRTLMNENQRPGEYTVRLYTSGLPAGVYFIRLQAGEQVETVKMVVMR